ncbi:hypothetical protein HHI36_024039 [Cryptolaemus montrouzieri]|uniref:SIAH-type domain-containing protein n=1 Tax=Cryptolaemus montrouzieri TaxID=559131 RepID=A0ABD2NZD6_9CUCU
MDNELCRNINIQLKEENIKMRYENLLLQKEIEHLKYVLVESQKIKNFFSMSDKNIILRENNKLLAERITQLQNRPIEKIVETKPEKSNQNKVDIPLSLPSTLKPAYSSMVKNVTESGPSSRNTQTTTNNKKNFKIELKSNQKLTPTKTIANQEVKKIQGNQQHNQTTSKQKRETTLLYIEDEISESKEEQQSPKVKIQQERENWREVVKKRNPKQTRPVPIKGAMDKFSLTIAEQQSCLFLSGLDPDIEPEEVKEYIDTTFKMSSKCEKMKTKKDRFKSSFKVYVPTDSKQQVLNENMWERNSNQPFSTHQTKLQQRSESEMASFLRELYNTIIKCSECQEHFFGTSIYTTKIGDYFTCGKCVAKKITERKTFFGARKTGIHLPCPSYHYGCGEVLPKEEMDEHKEDCAYGFTCCTSFSSCVDVFHYNDVEEHYKMKHPECIRNSATQNYVYTSRRSSVYEKGFVIISAFGYRFKIIWRANLISYKLYYLGFNFGFVDNSMKRSSCSIF